MYVESIVVVNYHKGWWGKEELEAAGRAGPWPWVEEVRPQERLSRIKEVYKTNYSVISIYIQKENYQIN